MLVLKAKMMAKLFISLIFVMNLGPAFGEVQLSDESGSLVISKDMTIPERRDYENIVVISGVVDFFGKTEKLVVLGGKVKLHSGAEVRNQLIVLGGSVEQDKGAIVPEVTGPKVATTFKDRLRSWIDEHTDKWKQRFRHFQKQEDEDAESDESASGFHWSKIFVFPLLLAAQLTFLILIFGLAMIFFALAPRLADGADQTLRDDPFISLLYGGAAYLFFAPILVLLALTIVGIPLIPLVVFFAILFVLAGLFATTRMLGQVVLKPLRIESKAVHTLIGLFLFYALFFIPIIGNLLGFLLLTAGTGAVIRSGFGHRIRFQRF